MHSFDSKITEPDIEDLSDEEDYSEVEEYKPFMDENYRQNSKMVQRPPQPKKDNVLYPGIDTDQSYEEDSKQVFQKHAKEDGLI